MGTSYTQLLQRGVKGPHQAQAQAQAQALLESAAIMLTQRLHAQLEISAVSQTARIQVRAVTVSMVVKESMAASITVSGQEVSVLWVVTSLPNNRRRCSLSEEE